MSLFSHKSAFPLAAVLACFLLTQPAPSFVASPDSFAYGLNGSERVIEVPVDRASGPAASRDKLHVETIKTRSQSNAPFALADFHAYDPRIRAYARAGADHSREPQSSPFRIPAGRSPPFPLAS